MGEGVRRYKGVRFGASQPHHRRHKHPTVPRNPHLASNSSRISFRCQLLSKVSEGGRWKEERREGREGEVLEREGGRREEGGGIEQGKRV